VPKHSAVFTTYVEMYISKAQSCQSSLVAFIVFPRVYLQTSKLRRRVKTGANLPLIETEKKKISYDDLGVCLCVMDTSYVQ
jgi:hypothetical protein